MGGVGRGWTHLIHPDTKCTNTPTAIPPEEELRSEWTPSAQRIQGPYRER